VTNAADSRTIFALSSGAPPAAIAIVRVSGPGADVALERLAGELPAPRIASLRTLRHPASGETLDRALTLRFPGPDSATGEDLVELHLHGGRAVVAGLLDALAGLPGLRAAEPGEFTRRAFENGRIDLAQAEGLADLLQAETQNQRRAALALAGGALSRRVSHWQERLLSLSARLESVLDFSDEGEVGEALPEGWREDLDALAANLEIALTAPSAERLKDGVRVVIAGPPNAGKSSLLNWLVGRQAAITSAIAGTTRDVIEAPTAIGGTPFVLVDTAGLRESVDEVEAIGVSLAQQRLAAADLILWLGPPAECPDRSRALVVQSKADLLTGHQNEGADIAVSAETGQGMQALIDLLVQRARALLPGETDVALHARHRQAIGECLAQLRAASMAEDFLIAGEALRLARMSLDRLTGRAGVEDMLDHLFGQFCIGK
jgi:tRNA modification GTPase